MSSCGTCLHFIPSSSDSLGGMCTRHHKLVALVSPTCKNYDENNPFETIAKVIPTAFQLIGILLLISIPLLGIGYIGNVINSKIQTARDALYATPIVSDLNSIDSELAFYDLDDDGCIRLNDLKWLINRVIGLNNAYERHKLKIAYTSRVQQTSMRETVSLLKAFEDIHKNNYKNDLINEKAYNALNEEFEKCKMLLESVIFASVGISFDVFAADIINGSLPRKCGDFAFRFFSTNINKNGKIDFSKTVFLIFDDEGNLQIADPINTPPSGVFSPLN